MQPPKVNDFEDLIEKILDVDKKEVQTIEMKQSASGNPYWDITLYSHRDDAELCANIAIKLDSKLRKTFLGEDKQFVPTTKMKDLKHFNKFRDPSTKIVLTRSAKGTYGCTVRSVSEINKEDEILEDILKIMDLVLGAVTKTVETV